MQPLFTALGLIGVGLLPVAAHAGTTTFTHSIPFLAAISGMTSFTETYEQKIGTVIKAGDTRDGITYTSFPTGTNGIVDNTFNHLDNSCLQLQRVGSPDSFFFPGDSFSVAFSAPVTAVGIFFNANVVDANGVPINFPDLFITTPVGSAGTGGPASNYDQGTFFFAGLVSDTPFTTATFSSLAGSTPFNADNLTYASKSAVPEPGSVALVAACLFPLMALGARRQRRK